MVPPAKPKTFSDKLRDHRERLQMTQDQAADYLEIPLRTYLAWEKGEYTDGASCEAAALARLEKALGRSEVVGAKTAQVRLKKVVANAHIIFILSGFSCFLYFVAWPMLLPERTSPAPSPSPSVITPGAEEFKSWCLSYTAVTDIEINGPSLFVTLKPEKYTNKENVATIARSLAKSYAYQAGVSYVNCRIYLSGKEYASGSFSK